MRGIFLGHAHRFSGPEINREAFMACLVGSGRVDQLLLMADKPHGNCLVASKCWKLATAERPLQLINPCTRGDEN